MILSQSPFKVQMELLTCAMDITSHHLQHEWPMIKKLGSVIQSRECKRLLPPISAIARTISIVTCCVPAFFQHLSPESQVLKHDPAWRKLSAFKMALLTCLASLQATNSIGLTNHIIFILPKNNSGIHTLTDFVGPRRNWRVSFNPTIFQHRPSIRVAILRFPCIGADK